jgi:tetratricopeptide (TPR) repeat protein
VRSIHGSAWRALASSRWEDAQRAFALTVTREPERGEAWLGFALSLWRAGDRFAALGAARRAVEVVPDSAEARVLFGDILRDVGDLSGARSALEIARTLDPSNAQTLRLLAGVYRRSQRPSEALTLAKEALERDPSSIDSLVCLGDALLANEALAEAENVYRVGLACDRRALRAAFGLGRVALARAAWHDARAAFERAREIAPTDPDVRYNLALLHLRFEAYSEGFAAYPAIMDTESDGARYYYHRERVPRWDGDDPSGRRVVISSDQGLGDHIMMARFLARLPANEPPIVVETPPALLTLFQRNFSNVTFERFTHWRRPAELDVHLPIMQLACVAGIARASDIAGEAYLRADPERVERWRARLGGDRGLRRIGIVWHGNRQNTRDRWRAAPLRHWAPLAAVPGVRCYSLQLDATDVEIADAPFSLSPAQKWIGDMDDTAALMTALDGIVSVDTSTIHLAGALGRPAWLANPLVSDFRWGVAGARSPWYSSVRIVRQMTSDNWQPVFEQIARELELALP